STSNAGSNFGHGAYASGGCVESNLFHNSSAIRGAKGWSKIKNSRKIEIGFVSHVIASFTKTIIAEIAVLKRMPSKSSVTFLMQACSVFICAGVAAASLMFEAT